MNANLHVECGTKGRWLYNPGQNDIKALTEARKDDALIPGFCLWMKSTKPELVLPEYL